MTSLDTQRTLGDGDFIQWYRVQRVLGRGGFGVTYLATDTNLDHSVAIKEYQPGTTVERAADNSLRPSDPKTEHDYQQGLQRFLREARTLVKFRHPNIVRVMAVFEANNTAYLVMEYEEGEQFKQFVKRDGGITEAELTTLILKVVAGLDQVHQHGYIHRDIKPVNLIIRHDGSPVLLDFGSARPAGVAVAGNHTSFVSVGYTPLEQYQEGAGLAVGPWTDIYALGATLYYAISGQTPMSPISRLAALVKKSPDPLVSASEVGAGHYSKRFLAAIDWALGFRIEDRPQNLSEWRAALVDEPVGGAFADYAAEGQLAAWGQGEQRPSNLLVSRAGRRKPLARRQTEPRKRSAVGLLSLLLVGAGIAVAGIRAYTWYHEKQEIQQLLLRADEASKSTVFFETAVPLYQQVLKIQPANTVALEGLAELSDRVRSNVEGSLQAMRLPEAEWGLRQLQSLDAEGAASIQSRLLLIKQKNADDLVVKSVERLVNQNRVAEARSELDRQASQLHDKSHIAVLEQSIQDTIAEIDKREAENAEKEQQRQLNQRLIEAASERQRLRRTQYNEYLRKAEQGLQDGDLATARSWLNNAASLQISDEVLADIEARLAGAETFQSTPLSTYEISYASGRFDSLKRAVETKNLRAIRELTEGSPSRLEFFRLLFARYTRLKVVVMDVAPMLDPKRVQAKLRIEELDLPNGDIVYPSPSYRDTALSLQRTQQGWSKIEW